MVKIVSSKWSVFEVLLFLIMAILLIMIMTRIFGHSATDIQIYIGVITGFFMMIGFIMKLFSNHGNLNREVGEMKIGMKNSFERVRDDFRMVREDIGGLRKDVSEIKELIKRK